MGVVKGSPVLTQEKEAMNVPWVNVVCGETAACGYYWEAWEQGFGEKCGTEDRHFLLL